MSSITWGVCSKQRTVTVFCMTCREVSNLHAPVVEALELKMAAEASHVCPGAPHPLAVAVASGDAFATSIHVRPAFDLATPDEKKRQRVEIDADIARFEAAGGKVQLLALGVAA